MGPELAGRVGSAAMAAQIREAHRRQFAGIIFCELLRQDISPWVDGRVQRRHNDIETADRAIEMAGVLAQRLDESAPKLT